jgi:hypothetical protein
MYLIPRNKARASKSDICKVGQGKVYLDFDALRLLVSGYLAAAHQPSRNSLAALSIQVPRSLSGNARNHITIHRLPIERHQTLTHFKAIRIKAPVHQSYSTA